MRRVRVVSCKECKFYTSEGISERCYHEKNVYDKWLGQCFIESPDHKNYNGKCEYYEKLSN